MKNYICSGKTITWTNGTGAAVAAGDPVLVGNRIGIACVDIGIDGVGEVDFEGVYLVAKAAGSYVQGAALYWDDSAKNFTTTATAHAFAGHAHKAATGDTIEIKLAGPQPAKAANVAAVGVTANLVADGAVVADIALATAGGNTYSDAAVNTAVNAMVAEVKTALGLKPDQDKVEARLDAIETKVDAILTALKNAGMMATS